MNIFQKIGRATMTAIKAFQEYYVTSDTENLADFESYDGRQSRYDVLWAFFENNAYRNVHTWAQAYRNQYGLYKSTRNIYNPAYRLGDFYKMLCWGGRLDANAGESGALPIKILPGADERSLRAAIAQVWAWSNWAINKDIHTMRGAVLGDCAIIIRDDTERRQSRLELLHPAVIKSIDVDHAGFVKSYTLEEARIDENGRSQTYTETAERGQGDDVIFRTYMNGNPYAWGNPAAEWTVPYGFVPLVLTQHNNVGLAWGWAEMHPIRSKINEVDDLASKLDDQIRKTVDPAWLYNFAKPKKEANRKIEGADPTADRPEPWREETNAVWVADTNAKAQALVAPIDIGQTLATIQSLLSELERDMPELQMDIWSAGGDTSGRALRVARERVIAKVVQRRANYDSGLVRAHQMAIAIAGWRRYDGFAGYDLTSYAAGRLNHEIADRPVFGVDPADKRLEMLELIKAGVPKEVAWAIYYTPEQIAEMKQTDEYKSMLALMRGGLADDETGA